MPLVEDDVILHFCGHSGCVSTLQSILLVITVHVLMTVMLDPGV